MKNLLNSTDIATLFLDNDLNVRRFTPQATKIIKLIPADLGRPITDLASELKYPELADDAREILRTLASAEKPIAARDGRWFTVRIMPYQTLDDRIDGVVITFADITVAKALEAKLRDHQSALEKHLAGQSAKLDVAKEAMRAEIADRKTHQRAQGIERLTGAVSLVGEGRIAETIADDDLAALQRRLDYLRGQLRSGGVKEQGIRRRHRREFGSAEQDLADFLAQSRPARFAGHHAAAARRSQPGGQSLGLG